MIEANLVIFMIPHNYFGIHLLQHHSTTINNFANSDACNALVSSAPSITREFENSNVRPLLSFLSHRARAAF